MTTIAEESRPVPEIDSEKHLTLAGLEKKLSAHDPSPRVRGEVVLLCSRLESGERWLPRTMIVDPAMGFPGDRWHWGRAKGQAKYTVRYQEMQVATMEARVAEVVANGQPLSLFGDNLFLQLDLSQDNLSAGSRLVIGGATFEVTPFPHNGCQKFHQRFGADALRFVGNKETRHCNRRGIYLRVIEGGEIGVGGAVRVLSRPAAC